MSEQQQLSLVLRQPPAPRVLQRQLPQRLERQQERPVRRREQQALRVRQQALPALPVLQAARHRGVARVLVGVVAPRPVAGQR